MPFARHGEGPGGRESVPAMVRGREVWCPLPATVRGRVVW